MSGNVTPLQAAWLPTRQSIDDARAELDAETFAVLVQLLTVLVARMNAERVEPEWRMAA
jgi:hypothetical protein